MVFYKSTHTNGRSIKRNKHTFYYNNRILFLKGEDHSNKNLLNFNDIEWGSSTKINLNKKYFTIKHDETIFITLGSVHRIENPYKKSVKIIEAQVGSILKETDIVRFQNVNNRV